MKPPSRASTHFSHFSQCSGTPQDEEKLEGEGEKYDDEGNLILGWRDFEIASILQISGAEFLKGFQRLITPRGGKAIVSIEQQIADVVDVAVEVDDLSLFFDPLVAIRVYYVISTLLSPPLCNA